MVETFPQGGQIALLSTIDPDENAEVTTLLMYFYVYFCPVLRCLFAHEQFNYTIVSDPSGFFVLNGRKLVVAPNAAFNFASGPRSFTLSIRTTDDGKV